jgi:hypothetical protein
MKITSETFVDDWNLLSFDVRIEAEDGTVTEKRLSAADYLDMFQSGVKQVKTFVEVPRLPEEVVWAATADEQDTFKAVIVLPEAKRPVFFCNEIIDNIPFPKLCFYVRVEGGVRKETSLFAVNKKGLLCHYPFGNVYDSGDCCFGNIIVQDVRNAAEALKVADAFLTGETNDHLWNPIGKFELQGDFYEALQGKKAFPERYLRKLDGTTVKDLCRA